MTGVFPAALEIAILGVLLTLVSIRKIGLKHKVPITQLGLVDGNMVLYDYF